MSAHIIFDGIGETALGVLRALAPLVVLFVVFQFRFMKLPGSYFLNLLKGVAVAGLGLVLLLQGLRVGFLPAGEALGRVMGAMEVKQLLIPIGFSLGFLTTWGEPAVRVFSDQVEKASAGSIRKNIVLITMAIGVASFVALGMAKVVYGIPLTYVIVPGYALAIGLMWFSDKTFVSLAFDAGGVASGPVSDTFLLALGVGIASTLAGRNPVADGFGLVALISLSPLLSVMILGMIFRAKLSKKE